MIGVVPHGVDSGNFSWRCDRQSSWHPLSRPQLRAWLRHLLAVLPPSDSYLHSQLSRWPCRSSSWLHLQHRQRRSLLFPVGRRNRIFFSDNSVGITQPSGLSKLTNQFIRLQKCWERVCVWFSSVWTPLLKSSLQYWVLERECRGGSAHCKVVGFVASVAGSTLSVPLKIPARIFSLVAKSFCFSLGIPWCAVGRVFGLLGLPGYEVADIRRGSLDFVLGCWGSVLHFIRCRLRCFFYAICYTLFGANSEGSHIGRSDSVAGATSIMADVQTQATKSTRCRGAQSRRPAAAMAGHCRWWRSGHDKTNLHCQSIHGRHL